jgi:hypothetical protein
MGKVADERDNAARFVDRFCLENHSPDKNVHLIIFAREPFFYPSATEELRRRRQK